jgi:hypothetical protein
MGKLGAMEIFSAADNQVCLEVSLVTRLSIFEVSKDDRTKVHKMPCTELCYKQMPYLKSKWSVNDVTLYGGSLQC